MTERQKKNFEKETQSICAAGLIQCLMITVTLMASGVAAVYAMLDDKLTLEDVIWLLAVIPIVMVVLIWLVIRRTSKRVVRACPVGRKKSAPKPEAPVETVIIMPEPRSTRESRGISAEDFL